MVGSMFPASCIQGVSIHVSQIFSYSDLLLPIWSGSSVYLNQVYLDQVHVQLPQVHLAAVHEQAPAEGSILNDTVVISLGVIHMALFSDMSLQYQGIYTLCKRRHPFYACYYSS